MGKPKALIVGAGAMGFPLATALQATNAYQIYLADDSKQTQQKANAAGFPFFTNLPSALNKHPDLSIIVLATPTIAFEENFKILATLMPANCVLTDISSATKKQLWQLATEFLPDKLLACYIPSNPQAGTVQQASYQNVPVYLCQEYAQLNIYQQLVDFWQSLGAQPIKFSTVDAHDRLTVLTSLWPHIFAFAVQQFCAQSDGHNPELLSVELMHDLGRTMNPTADQKADQNRLYRWQRFMGFNQAQTAETMSAIAFGMSAYSQNEGMLLFLAEELHSHAVAHPCATRNYPAATLNFAVYLAALSTSNMLKQLIKINNLSGCSIENFMSPSLQRFLACGLAAKPIAFGALEIAAAQAFINYLEKTGTDWRKQAFDAFGTIVTAFAYHQDMAFSGKGAVTAFNP